ncbi:hypothetical protein MMC30_007016 [Trapelia coarctata]|nr:hypothetical protein [Trapelia coarctata]
MQLTRLLSLSLFAALAQTAPLPPLPPAPTGPHCVDGPSSQKHRLEEMCFKTPSPLDLSPPPKLDLHLLPAPRVAMRRAEPALTPRQNRWKDGKCKGWLARLIDALFDRRGLAALEDESDGCVFAAELGRKGKGEPGRRVHGPHGRDTRWSGKLVLVPRSAYTQEMLERCKDRWEVKSLAALSEGMDQDEPKDEGPKRPALEGLKESIGNSFDKTMRKNSAGKG